MSMNDLRKEVQQLRTESDSLNSRFQNIEKMIIQFLQMQSQTQTSLINDEQPASEPIPKQNSSFQNTIFPTVINAQPQNVNASSTTTVKRYWDAEEHARYLQAIYTLGKAPIAKISQFIGTRTPEQVRSHGQKYTISLDKCLKEVELQMPIIIQDFQLQLCQTPFQRVFRANEPALFQLCRAAQPSFSQLLASTKIQLSNNMEEALVNFGLASLQSIFKEEMIRVTTIKLICDPVSIMDYKNWNGSKVQLVTSQSITNYSGKILNCNLIKNMCEHLLIQGINSLDKQPVELLIKILLVYQNLIKQQNDPPFFNIWNCAQACGLQQKLPELMLIIFCANVIIICK
ncbi:Myb-like_DNA-binding domain-containing protein [Hexamita inflata]|uniref:Myb-like DNA-binding domain-containing protein n=1 Tax=Hexamita inflata TaxID=28002 RepID=A0AA86UJJ2_9EUKA|nr:Myb-like DNA-binding domain-containing protein [Hexamita inflata]